MDVRRAICPALFALFFFDGCLSLAQAQQTAAPVERPDLRPGDRWKVERKDARTKLVVLAEETVVTAVTGEKVDVTINGIPGTMTADLTTTDSPRLSYDNGYQFLRFPLEVGKKWDFKTSWQNKANGSKGKTEMEVTVKSLERVRVAAGEFDAIKAEAVGYMTFAGGGNRRVQATYWYAPAAKAIVRMDWADRNDDFLLELAELSMSK